MFESFAPCFSALDLRSAGLLRQRWRAANAAVMMMAEKAADLIAKAR